MACFEEALEYSKNRVMFDRPIGGFQIQQVRLADMLTEIVKAQLVSLHLGRMKDAGNFTPQQVSLAKRNNVSMATDIAALVADKGFTALQAPVRRVTAPHTPVPFAPSLEKLYIPDPERIAAAVREVHGFAR